VGDAAADEILPFLKAKAILTDDARAYGLVVDGSAGVGVFPSPVNPRSSPCGLEYPHHGVDVLRQVLASGLGQNTKLVGNHLDDDIRFHQYSKT
jgi:hypothetical protein